MSIPPKTEQGGECALTRALLAKRHGTLHRMRRQHDATVKAKGALEAIKVGKSIAQIAGEWGIHPKQNRLRWDQGIAALPAIISGADHG